ncbi:hypothetical protein LTR09_005483 [Extremus antarcticus]|uniref:Uncharacterized protein n=1 Tax=Extremus antarcticus TaxID=702011 RepID=A0AAJ0GDN3_9PEZI|nr:hypothetical protein LTR09_005483 [Extremus antarcticus]
MSTNDNKTTNDNIQGLREQIFANAKSAFAACYSAIAKAPRILAHDDFDILIYGDPRGPRATHVAEVVWRTLEVSGSPSSPAPQQHWSRNARSIIFW